MQLVDRPAPEGVDASEADADAAPKKKRAKKKAEGAGRAG